MCNPFTRLALYMAYKAGLLTWQQLPLTTQAACIVAGSLAAQHAYVATLCAASAAANAAAVATTGGNWLTNPGHAPVAKVHGPSTTCGTVPYRKVG